MQFNVYPLHPHSTDDLSQDQFPTLLRTWQRHSLNLPATGTHFGFVYQGNASLVRGSHDEGVDPNHCDHYPLRPGMYFCLPEVGQIHGEHSAGIVITRLNHQGIFTVGGPMASTGRLAYINGGMTNVLIPPVMQGEACLNAMYLPPGIDQTLHTHPSYRIGVVVSGEGKLETPQISLSIASGHLFLIPASRPHQFRTLDQGLTVVVFHPDSDTGFSHQNNPMLTRTLVNGISAVAQPQIHTKPEYPSTRP
jgi:quercetin dioxygenase-like cupin family protein